MRFAIAFATLSLLSKAALGEDVLYAYPTIRYTMHDGLSFSQGVAVSKFGYSDDSWNNPGTDSIELLSYETITEGDPSLVGGFGILKISEDQWDCYVNHYDDYDWDEIEEYSIDNSLSLLGYNEDNWEDDELSDVEQLSWSELSEAQKAAADDLCWIEETWDNIPLTVWGLQGQVADQIDLEDLSCFAGTNTVQVLGKGPTFMEDLKIGDSIMGPRNKYSRVYSMAHIDRNIELQYLQFRSSKSETPLEISSDHIVFVNNGEVKRSLEVKIGDKLQNDAVVTAIQTVKRRGLYAPLTMSGELLVSEDFSASSFVSMTKDVSVFAQHLGAHSAMAPLRWACSLSFHVCENEEYTEGRSNFVWTGIQALWRIADCSPFIQQAILLLSVPALATLWILDQLFLAKFASGALCAVAAYYFVWRKQPKSV